MEYWPIQSGNQTSQAEKSPMKIRVYSWENQRTLVIAMFDYQRESKKRY